MYRSKTNGATVAENAPISASSQIAVAETTARKHRSAFDTEALTEPQPEENDQRGDGDIPERQHELGECLTDHLALGSSG